MTETIADKYQVWLRHEHYNISTEAFHCQAEVQDARIFFYQINHGVHRDNTTIDGILVGVSDPIIMILGFQCSSSLCFCWNQLRRVWPEPCLFFTLLDFHLLLGSQSVPYIFFHSRDLYDFQIISAQGRCYRITPPRGTINEQIWVKRNSSEVQGLYTTEPMIRSQK